MDEIALISAGKVQAIYPSFSERLDLVCFLSRRNILAESLEDGVRLAFYLSLADKLVAIVLRMKYDNDGAPRKAPVFELAAY